MSDLPTDFYSDRPTADQLEALPTLCVSQADDLKIEDEIETGPDRWERVRFWLSRCGIIDGEPFERTISVETFDPDSGRWSIVLQYNGDNVSEEIALDQ